MGFLLNMVDGGAFNISSDNEAYGGCSTCDWGSEYINEFDIYMTTGTLHIRVVNMYEYAMSEGFFMKLFLSNTEEIADMTEEEFVVWLKKQIEAELGWAFDGDEDGSGYRFEAN